MRADRLLSIMLLLQSTGRMTAQTIAQELEISERTVYRDIEALSMAGIPVYAQPGTNGGIFLDEKYRVSLTGLAKDQVLSLFASTEGGPLEDIGLAHALKEGLLKLFSTLPLTHQHDVERMHQRFHIDPAGWFNFGDTSLYLNVLQGAVWEDTQVEFSYQSISRETDTIRIDAYALVSKADKWYLVGRKLGGEYRTYRLTRILDLRVLESPFERDNNFNLVQYWKASRHQFQQQMSDTFPPYFASLSVHPEIFWYFGRFLEGRFEQTREPDKHGWSIVHVQFAHIDEARTHVVALGTRARIIAPDQLRHDVLALAEALVAHYEE